MDYLSHVLYNLQEFETKEYFSPCRKGCRKIIKDSAKSVKLSLSSEIIGGGLSFFTGVMFLGASTRTAVNLFTSLTGVNGLLERHCSLKCILKTFEKRIRRMENKGIDTKRIIMEYQFYKNQSGKLVNAIDKSIAEIARKDKIKSQKLKRLLVDINDNVELFSI